MFQHSSSLICIDDSTNFTICISNDRTVFSVGVNDFNSHGFDNYKIFPIKQTNNLTNINMIDCSSCHTVCLDYNGELFSFGYNYNGLLGIGKTYDELKQTHIPQKINVPSCKQISCGFEFTVCLTEDNRLYSFGHNLYGQLALGDNNEFYSSPQLIIGLNNIEVIECGGYHCICKTYNNEFYSWGNNNYGQLGQGNNNNCNKPIQCINWPVNIIDIKSGYHHSLLLTSEGQVYSFGFNDYGQLGINDENIESLNIPTLIKDIPEIQRIDCGYAHSMCIEINNQLWLFGFNYAGQLGLGDKEDRYKPILHPTLSNIIDISSGGCHTFVKTIENRIYAFGNNDNSQLGIETSKYFQLTPIQVFEGKEEVWCSTIGRSKAKSARK